MMLYYCHYSVHIVILQSTGETRVLIRAETNRYYYQKILACLRSQLPCTAMAHVSLLRHAPGPARRCYTAPAAKQADQTVSLPCRTASITEYVRSTYVVDDSFFIVIALLRHVSHHGQASSFSLAHSQSQPRPTTTLARFMSLYGVIANPFPECTIP